MAASGVNRAKTRAEIAQDRVAALARKNRESAASTEGAINDDMSIGMVVKGVSAGWLAQAFGINLKTINTRLKNCPALKRTTGGKGILYDLKTATPYLVKPKFDIVDYLRNSSIEELPTKFQKEFWDAAIKKQTWEERAGQLWSTAEVSKKFSETFLMAQNNMTMWVSNIEARVSMTEQIRLALEEEVRSLQNQISKKIKEMPRVTPSQKATIKDDLAPQIEEDDDDFDISDVV